jgi:hypothetical protein
MQSAVTHRVHRHFHAATLDAADHRDIEAQLADQGLHFAQQFCAVTQTDHQHMGATQGQGQVAQGVDGIEFNAISTQLSSLGLTQWTERVQPDGLKGVNSGSFHIDQPVTKVWLISNACASLFIEYF